MKKLFLLSAAALAFASAPALAQSADGTGPGPGPRDNKMFEMHDANGDGVVTEAEFLDRAKERFAQMDADGDGKLTQEEAKAAHESMRDKFKEKRMERRKMRDGSSSESE